MNTLDARLALVSFFSIVSLSSLGVVGCSAGEPAPLDVPPSNSSRTPSASNGSSQAPASGTQTQEGAPATGDTAQPGQEASGDPAGSKQPSDPGTKDPGQADAQCVASCNSGLKAKCEGDDTFCEDMCISFTATELSCLSSAPTCDKPEWIRCMPEPEDDGGGSK
jgi:hypothetical protein